MNNKLKQMLVKKYYFSENESINVEFTTDGYFYATGVAKLFSEKMNMRKEVNSFLKTQQTQEYIDELIKLLNSQVFDLYQTDSMRNDKNQQVIYDDFVIVKRGGNNAGTWLHPKLAILFARWLDARFAIWCDLQIEEILKQQSENAVPKISHEKYQIAIEVAKATGEMLRLSDTSKLRMMYAICETYQVDSQFLPYYVEQNPTGSLTDLLDEFKLKHLGSARKINLILEKLGIIEKITRKSTSSPTGQKKFWSLTSKGLEFGKNESSAQNPRETQPHYFREKFLDLTKLIQNV